MASSRHGGSQTASPPLTDSLPAPIPQGTPETGAHNILPHQHFSIQDLKTIAADIKDTLSASISELQLDIYALSDRVHETERVSAQQGVVLRRTTLKIDSHTLQLRDLQQHMEDLDNRGRCHNLRIRGLPELVDHDQLPSTVTNMFNNLLDRPAQTEIAMKRIHRALRPKGRDADPPRDVICCIVDYKIKEEIQRKARNRTQLVMDRANIQIFQDLSGITLQHRRDLKPLLDTLRAHGIQYKWKFPFCLSATSQGRTGTTESARRSTALL